MNEVLKTFDLGFGSQLTECVYHYDPIDGSMEYAEDYEERLKIHLEKRFASLLI